MDIPAGFGCNQRPLSGTITNLDTNEVARVMLPGISYEATESGLNATVTYSRVSLDINKTTDDVVIECVDTERL